LLNDIIEIAGPQSSKEGFLRLFIILSYAVDLYDIRKALVKQGKPIPLDFPRLTNLDVEVYLKLD
jgi:hypothetical protein